MNNKRALLTGGSSSLVQESSILLNRLGYEVVTTTSGYFTNKIESNNVRVDFYDPKTWFHRQFEKPFDFVLHGASISPSSLNPDFILGNFKAPIEFFSRLRFKSETKFVFCSTSGVYGLNHHAVITEKTKPNPIDDYSRSKLLFEDNIQNVITNNGSRGHLLILRIPTLIGRKVSRNLISRWTDAVSSGREIRVFNANNSFSSLVSEIDLSHRIIQEDKKYEFKKTITNCYSNGDLTYLEAARLISKTLNGKDPVIDNTEIAPSLMLKNSEDNWFDRLSSRSSLLYYLSKI